MLGASHPPILRKNQNTVFYKVKPSQLPILRRNIRQMPLYTSPSLCYDLSLVPSFFKVSPIIFSMNIPRLIVPALAACSLLLPSCKSPEEQALACVQELAVILEGVRDKTSADKAAETVMGIAGQLEELQTQVDRNKTAGNNALTAAIRTATGKYMTQLQRLVEHSFYGSRQLRDAIRKVTG